MRVWHLLIVGCVALFVAGCGGSSGGGGVLPPAVAALVSEARASAGPDFYVVPGAVGVTLDGTGSAGLNNGTITSYAWSQTAGTAVTLTNSATDTATFTAPGAAGDLTFALAVNGTYVDWVTIHVQNMVVEAGADMYDIGFGIVANLDATVTGGTGPYTYAWTGAEDWMPLSSATIEDPSFTTPAIDQAMVLPDVFGILGMYGQGIAHISKLKLTVTDSTLATASDYVMVNIISPCNGQTIVPVGVPVVINGGMTVEGENILSWTWAGDPDYLLPDLTTPLAGTGEQVVTFIPDEGTYQVICYREGATELDAHVLTITAAEYTGVGGLASGSVPDPELGECAGCHEGQFWFDDKVTPWSETGHATIFNNLVGGYYQGNVDWDRTYCLQCHSTGFFPAVAADNGGFDDAAADSHWALAGATSTSVINNYPELANKANVQCETCHGPGSWHVGSTQFVGAAWTSDVCGGCHPQLFEWNNSGHNDTADTAVYTSSCGDSCHSGPHWARKVSGGSDPTVAWGPQSCQVCHDPHSDENHYQLRMEGEAELPNGVVVEAGYGAMCVTCHQSRRDTTDPGILDDPDSPHHAVQGDVFFGTNAVLMNGVTEYANSPHGDSDEFIVPGDEHANACVTCHMEVAWLTASTAHGAPTYNTIGGHTFTMEEGDGVTVLATEADGTTATFVAADRTVAFATGNLMGLIHPGDSIAVTGGVNNGSTFTVEFVYTGRMISVIETPTDGVGTAYNIVQEEKLHLAACTQCHVVGPDFNVTARADYDGDSVTEGVGDEVDGLLALLEAAIIAELDVLTTFGGNTLGSYHGNLVYNNPTEGNNQSFHMDSPEWDVLAAAAYNYYLIEWDHSGGVHNTGFAVDVLRNAIEALTGAAPAGADYSPY